MVQAAMSLLSPVTGPKCPKCGCQRSELIRRYDRWGRPAEERRCGHCGMQFHALVQDGVVYHRVRCPECGSKNVGVTGTRPKEEGLPRIRWHKCRDCEHSFKSVEED